MARKQDSKKVVVKRKRVGVRQSVSDKHPAWSNAMYWSFIRSGLRAKFLRYPVKYIVLAEAKRPAKPSTGKLKWEYQCSYCANWYPQKDIALDHIVPCGSLKSYADLPGFVERMFCHADGLQVLCTGCHKLKTQRDKEDG